MRMHRTIVGKRPHAELQHLIYTVFQRPTKAESTEGVCIVFTSALHNEGVTYVVRRLGQELAQHDDKNTLIIDSAYLQKLTPIDLEQIAASGRRDSNRYCILTADSSESQACGKLAMEERSRLSRTMPAHSEERVRLRLNRLFADWARCHGGESGADLRWSRTRRGSRTHTPQSYPVLRTNPAVRSRKGRRIRSE